MKKAQAALEFMTTYGWVISVVLVLTGSIMYFGIFDTGSFTKPYCELTKELVCDDYGMFENGITVVLRNNFEKEISLYNITISTVDGADTQTCPLVLDMKIGNQTTLTCKFASNVVPKGKKEQININVAYSRKGGTNIYTASGSMLSAAMDAI